MTIALHTGPFLALADEAVTPSGTPLRVVDLGVVHVPSGFLEASDPYVSLGRGHVVVEVGPGSYPVRVTQADQSSPQGSWEHVREAYLSVVVRDGEVAQVRKHVPEGEPVPGPDEAYGVGVDAGTVGFADAAAANDYLCDEAIAHGATEMGWMRLQWDETVLAPDAADVAIPGAVPAANVVLCGSGWGDGFYAVLTTHDADGEMLGVHIDLGLVLDDDEDDDN